MSWLRLLWHIGKWSLCILFQRMQPYMFWWCVVLLKHHFIKDEAEPVDDSSKLNINIDERDHLWGLQGHVDRKWWWETNGFSLIIIQLEVSFCMFAHPPPPPPHPKHIHEAGLWPQLGKTSSLSGYKSSAVRVCIHYRVMQVRGWILTSC